MIVIALVGGAYFVLARPDRGVARHVHERERLEAEGVEQIIST